MTTLVLSIGITVIFLTVWGVIMVGSYLLRSGATEVPSTTESDWVSPSTDLADGGLH